jgi:hypothetical protein
MKVASTRMIAVAITMAAAFVAMPRLVASEDARVEALGEQATFRCHFSFKTPVVLHRDGSLHVPMDGEKEPEPLPDYETPAPPDDWVQPGFDDADWPRLQMNRPIEVNCCYGRSASGALAAAANHLICVRAPFRVANPAAATDLRLTVEYVGGVLVHVNGREVARGHLPAGDVKPDTLADAYPDDLCVGPDNTLVYAVKDKEKRIALNEARYRSLADVTVPANLLRKGLNVLTLEIHRAPVNEGTLSARRPPVGGMSRVYGLYAYAGLRGLSLTGAAGAVESAQPAGTTLWRPDRVETVTVGTPPALSGPPKAVAIAGARNAVFSDRLVVSSGSEEPVKGLKVTVSEVTRAGGTEKLPASTVAVRYAAPFDEKKTHGPADRFDALCDEPPACATVPIWLTARILADAAAGCYEGKVAVEAEGLPRVEVPLRLTVYAWTLPDTKDWTVGHYGQSMTEHLAEFYGVPRWSDRHFELIGRSLALMAEVNMRTAVVNLTAPGNYAFDNTESMVRWVRQADGSFTYDFTIFEKYLDVVAEKLGKPAPLRINIYTSNERKDGKRTYKGGLEPRVTVIDSATGEMERMEVPIMGTPESVAFWKPVLEEVRKRLERRGWWQVSGIGHTAYSGGPDEETLSVFRKIWPDFRGVSQQHGLAASFGEDVPVIAAGTVWNEGHIKPRGYSGLWNKEPWLVCGSYARNRHSERGGSALVIMRSLPEEMVMRNHHGVFPMGVDLWKLYDANGRAWNVSDNSALGPGCSTRAILAPGPDGAVSTERFEMFRESSEVCEAIVFLQRAREEGRITGPTAEKVDRLLDARARNYLRTWSGMNTPYPPPYNDHTVWRALTAEVVGDNAEIYALCAEVQREK